MTSAPPDWERPIYVLHKHDASQLHYDLRLEFDGVLKSWAVPKGPPGDDKHLAIEVDDHPLSYADFEGTIEEGYGAGTVEIYDHGTFTVDHRSDEKIIVTLKGDKLQGTYNLIHFKDDGDKRLWLWFKASSNDS